VEIIYSLMGDPPALPVSVFGFTSSSVHEVIVTNEAEKISKYRSFFIFKN
jgi:hypothetical protein